MKPCLYQAEAEAEVDESRWTAVQSSTVDGSLSLVWFTNSFTFQPRSAWLHSSPSFYQSRL